MTAREPQVVDEQEFIDILDYHFTGNEVTVNKKRVFIQGLVDTHTVYRAAQIADIAPKTAYQWQKLDTDFAEAWEDALESSTDVLETSMYERAKAHDTIAGIFLLKKYRPEFRDKVTVNVEVVRDEIQSRMQSLQLPEGMAALVPQFADQSDEKQKEDVHRNDGPQ
jgi:hypothetical protein